jgi:predicted unusual protein kinase regulating ubiquinone biosynthesis (AarF/ABC1/UbiB family)
MNARCHSSQVGQALSSRPDLLPPVYLRELAELQDQLPPFPTPVAMDVIRQELGREARPLPITFHQQSHAAARPSAAACAHAVKIAAQHPPQCLNLYTLTLKALSNHAVSLQAVQAQDGVRTHHYEYVPGNIAKSMLQIGEVYSELSEEPVNAASLGQVYRGRLRATGEEVAVKVQRPSIADSIAMDMLLLRRLMAAADANIPQVPACLNRHVSMS